MRHFGQRFAILGMVAALVACVPSAAHARIDRQADCSAASDADFNGDGFDDAVVGDPFADVRGQQGAGAAYVLLGGADGPGSGGRLPLIGPGVKAGDAFGWSVRAAHIDDDDCLDVLVGAPYTDAGGLTDSGAAYVFRGGPGDQAAAAQRIEAPGGTQEAGAHFGWSLAAARDDDGMTLAISAPHEDADGVTDAGAVYLRYPAEGSGWTLDHLTQNCDGVIGNSELGDEFGWSVAFGHFGGQTGQLDLAVGVPYENTDGAGQQKTVTGVPDTGSVTVVYDIAHAVNGKYISDKWELQNATKAVPVHEQDMFGYTMDYAEWRGAGYLAVSAPGADAGGVADSGLVQIFKAVPGSRLTPLRTVRLGANDLRSSPPTKRATLGWSLAFWNPGGVLCLAIGSPFESFWGKDTPESGVVRQVTVPGGEGGDRVYERKGSALPYEHFGWSVTDVGGRDGITPGKRLLVGVPDERSAGGGAVAVMNSATPVLLTPEAIIGGASADFGAAVSG